MIYRNYDMLFLRKLFLENFLLYELLKLQCEDNMRPKLDSNTI